MNCKPFFSRLAQSISLLLAFSQFGYAAKQQPPTELYATASDGTPLHWIVFTPEGNGPWPAVLIIHGGEFKGGSPTSSPEAINCGEDLAAAGYIAFSIEYRLAPNGILEGQVSDGRFPDQTDDVRLAVLAARSDARCNGQVGAVGGSSGGYHVAFAASVGTPGHDRVDVGVSLSGAYDLSDFSSNSRVFIDDVTNYVGVTTSETAILQSASPAFLLDARVTPLFLINSQYDPMPFGQLADMTNALDAAGVSNYQTLTLPGSGHSFANWPSVKEPAIAFLAASFNPQSNSSPTPPPQTEPTPSKMLLNVSTRARVETGNGVTIGGFIITGNLSKPVVLRAIGPSLAQAGLSDALSDPVLELYDSAGSLIAQNDNSSSLPANAIPTGFRPSSGLESVIAATLEPGSYTAVLRGANGASGVGLFELYDLDPSSSRITNISTRSEVSSGADVMIGGFIIGGAESAKVVVRAIGPSLLAAGISDTLPNPVLELYDDNGAEVFANDNWQDAQAQLITASGLAPSNNNEAAILATLSPGGYTAMVHDANGRSGIALVEVYNLATE